ncbi:FeoC-like transcriptional regulator [Chitinimonas lacunae]|uniref:FeoC-like transcriptional regulator n=1 Tax=Chitinimonas lacunae TaxID=1963018 RepID=A0ABV8MLN4_9NEIS
MLLADLRKRLIETGALPLRQLSRQSGLSEEALLERLQPWLRKGRVVLVERRLPSCARSCGGCAGSSGCEGEQWIEWQADEKASTKLA